jgi:hypothetical protein
MNLCRAWRTDFGAQGAAPAIPTSVSGFASIAGQRPGRRVWVPVPEFKPGSARLSDLWPENDKDDQQSTMTLLGNNCADCLS